MLDDHTFLCLCDRWYETARHYVDDIAGWRENASEAFWYRKWDADEAVEQFIADTGTLVAQIKIIDSGVNGKPLHKIAELVSRWQTDRNADRLPDQPEVQRNFALAMMIVIGVRDRVRFRSVDRRQFPATETGSADGAMLTDIEKILLRAAFELNATSADAKQTRAAIERHGLGGQEARKPMSRLVKAGYMESTKKAGGGYWLTNKGLALVRTSEQPASH